MANPQSIVPPQMAPNSSKKPIHSIVLDTGPLINNTVTISTIIGSAEQLYTTPAIISEIRDAATRSRVETTLLPFLNIKTPTPASYEVVAAFAKRTGDFSVLSRQDLGILALAYEVHCERQGGTFGLRDEPGKPVNVKPGKEPAGEEGEKPSALKKKATNEQKREKKMNEQNVEKKMTEQKVEKKMTEQKVEKKMGEQKEEKKNSETKVEKKNGEKKTEKKSDEQKREKKAGQQTADKNVTEQKVQQKFKPKGEKVDEGKWEVVGGHKEGKKAGEQIRARFLEEQKKAKKAQKPRWSNSRKQEQKSRPKEEGIQGQGTPDDSVTTTLNPESAEVVEPARETAQLEEKPAASTQTAGKKEAESEAPAAGEISNEELAVADSLTSAEIAVQKEESAVDTAMENSAQLAEAPGEEEAQPEEAPSKEEAQVQEKTLADTEVSTATTPATEAEVSSTETPVEQAIQPQQQTNEETPALHEQPAFATTEEVATTESLEQDAFNQDIIETIETSEEPVDSAAPTSADDDSEGEWITPENLSEHKKKDAGNTVLSLHPNQPQIPVATMTTDYAMQNVLLQMNLKLLSPAMQRIRQVRSTILRCHACFLVTKQMDKQFCTRCGGATLARVTCSTNEKGQFQIHLSKKYQYNNRGNKYSLPKPIGGTANGKLRGTGGGQGGWGRDLVLSEDQKEFTKQIDESKRNKARDLMDEDYLPGILTGDRTSQAGGRPKVGAGRNINSRKRF
jgi:RNA-binding protein NOB1